MTNRRDPLAGLRLGRAQLGIKLWKGSALLAVTQAHAGGYRCYSHAISRAHGRKLWPSAEAALAAWLGTLPTRIEATLNPPGMPLAFASGAVTVYAAAANGGRAAPPWKIAACHPRSAPIGHLTRRKFASVDELASAVRDQIGPPTCEQTTVIPDPQANPDLVAGEAQPHEPDFNTA